MKPRLPLIIVAVLATTLGLPPQYTIAQDKTVATVDGAPITEADLRFASLRSAQVAAISRRRTGAASRSRS